MSNSLNRRLRGKTIKIFGPPGTGKTENLLKRVQRYLRQGYSPDEICYVSFTNKAVNECVARVRKKFKEYDEDYFKYFRTLHSLAYMELGLTDSSLMDDNDYKDISDLLNVRG